MKNIMLNLYIHVNIHLTMNILLSRIISTLKRINALHPIPPNNTKPKQPAASSPQTLGHFLNDHFHIQVSNIDPTLSTQIHYLLQIAQCLLDYLYFKTKKPLETLIRISILSRQLELSFLTIEVAGQSYALSKSSLDPTQIKLRQSIQKDIRALNLDLQKAVGTAINSVMINLILAELQEAYEKARKAPNSSLLPEENEVFWRRLTKYIYPLINQSHLNVLAKYHVCLENFSTDHLALDVKKFSNTIFNATHIPSHNFFAEQLTAKLIYYIRRASFVINFTEKHGAECLRLFSKHHHPASSLSSFCVGTGAKWGLDLMANPSLDRKPYPVTLKYIEFLKSLKAETLPAQFLGTEAWLGESILTEESLALQLYFTHRFENETPDFSSSADQKTRLELDSVTSAPAAASATFRNAAATATAASNAATATSTAETNSFSGKTIANAVIELFEKNKSKAPIVSKVQVSIMTATLATFNKDGQYLLREPFRPHMLWFAKLTAEDPSTKQTRNVYHVFDDAVGEIKFNSEKSLSGWLEDYFNAAHLGSFSWDTSCRYSQIFNHFSLCLRNDALHAFIHAKDNPPLVSKDSFHPTNTHKDIFQLLVERCKSAPIYQAPATVTATACASAASKTNPVYSEVKLSKEKSVLQKALHLLEQSAEKPVIKSVKKSPVKPVWRPAGLLRFSIVVQIRKPRTPAPCVPYKATHSTESGNPSKTMKLKGTTHSGIQMGLKKD